MTTRCKFTCTGVRKYKGWRSADSPEFLYDAEFNVVTDGSEEDKKFFAATPSGTLKLSTVAADVFEPGKAYYVDISEAD